jgi:hypothetical protein
LVRKFTTRHQFKALLFGQLGGGSSLREIGAAMARARCLWLESSGIPESAEL